MAKTIVRPNKFGTGTRPVLDSGRPGSEVETCAIRVARAIESKRRAPPGADLIHEHVFRDTGDRRPLEGNVVALRVRRDAGSQRGRRYREYAPNGSGAGLPAGSIRGDRGGR